MPWIRKIPIVLLAAGLLSPATASAVPYETLRSEAGSRNLFTDGNLGVATAPFLEVDSFGATDRITVDGSPRSANGLPGPSAMIVGETTLLTDVGIGANGLIVRDRLATDYLTASTQVHPKAHWAALTDTEDTDPSSGALDSFGSLADIANSVTGASALGIPAKASIAGGVMDVSLAGDGLNVVALSGADARASGIRIDGSAAATGLVINVGKDVLDLGDGATDLGPLSANQVLFSFGGAATLPLRALAPESAMLAPLAAGKFSDNGVGDLLVIRNYGSGPKDRFLAFNDPFSFSTLILFAGPRAVATPEPGSLGLFAAGLAALAFATRRSRGHLSS